MSKSSLIVLSKPDVFWTGHNVSRPKCTHEQVPAQTAEKSHAILRQGLLWFHNPRWSNFIGH
jgi:hypothetical protein